MRGVLGSVPRLVWALAAVLAAGRAEAHHGKDFLIVETDELPHRGQVYFFSNQDYLRQDGEGRFTLSPSLLLGAFSRAAVEVHSHLEKEPGQSMRYEATAVALRVQLTPDPEPVGIGVAAEYELGRGETPDRFEARLIGAYRHGGANLTLNLIAGRVRGGEEETQLGYAIGFRPDLDKRLTWGIEGQGRFNGEGGHEVLLGLYSALGDRVTVKMGVGRGFSGAPDWTVRTGLVVRL